MLKKCFSVSIILIGVLCLFIGAVKSEEGISSFETKSTTLSGSVNKKEESKKEQKQETLNNYLGILSIPKINLNRGFYEYTSPLNTVDKNIEVIETSKMPDVLNGNLILASHSGNSKIAYFKHLDELQIKDEVYVYYLNKKYKYIIASIYDRKKTGYIDIVRDKNKNTITLITCKKNTNLQTVFIGYME